MGAIASQITSLTIVYSIVNSGADQRKHQSSALLAFVRRIYRRPVNSPHKWPVTRKKFPFDDAIMHFISSVEGCDKSICTIFSFTGCTDTRQNGRHYANDILVQFLLWKLFYFDWSLLKFVVKGLIIKPLSEPVITRFPMHICLSDGGFSSNIICRQFRYNRGWYAS